MKFLIVGLGNPGIEYVHTRHNVGWLALDALAGDAAWEDKRYAWRSQVKYKGRTLVLIKPTTYMNLSGKAVQYWLTQEKIAKQHMLVITDDLSLQFGKVRLRGKGSAGGHNGLKDIEAVLQTQEYARLRVGIGDQYAPGKQVDYVLGEFGPNEKPHLPELLGTCADAARAFSFMPLEQVMSQYNGNAVLATGPGPA
ncbi:MAG: aminoacyl-tRNA hydrolase [Bacteroidetes bacterium]|nr:aminoacyl-tRNA hydrolase [Bacteroidota bacterium]